MCQVGRESTVLVCSGQVGLNQRTSGKRDFELGRFPPQVPGMAKFWGSGCLGSQVTSRRVGVGIGWDGRMLPIPGQVVQGWVRDGRRGWTNR